MSEQDSFDELNLPPSPSKSGYGDGDNSPAVQLKKVYKILSQSFSREVSSVADVQAVIKAFVNKYLKTKDSLKQQSELNEQLQSRLQESIDQTLIDEQDKEQLAANEEGLTKKLKQYKKHVLALQQQLSAQEAKTVEYQTNVGELQMKLEESGHEIARLTDELNQAKAQLSKEAPQKPETDPVEETAKLFEDLVSSQTQEITDLVHQRDILIQNVRSLDSAVRQAENVITANATEKEEREKQFQEIVNKNTQLSDLLPSVAQQVEQLIPHDLRSTLPQNSADAEKYILATVEALIQLRSTQTDENADESSQPCECVDKQKYIALLAYLEDAIRFIQNIAKPGDKASEISPLGIDSEVRNCLLTQCARIGHFVDENILAVGVENLPTHVSLFEAGSFQTAEEQLKEFLNFTTEDQLKESPLRELFALFCAVCEVNKMMMNYSEKLKAQQQQPERGPQASTDVIRNLQRDNFDLAQWKAVNQERILAATEVLKKLTEDDGDTAMDVMAKDLGERYEKVVAERDDLQERLEQIEKEHKELQETTQASIMEAKEEAQTRELTFQQEESRRLDESRELENKVSQLSQSNDNLKQRLQVTQEQFEAALREKTTKLKKALQAQSETKKMLDAIQQRTDAIVQENEQLHAMNAEMEETLNAQKEQLVSFAENQKKLRDSRENLKKRIAVAENENKTTLASIKQRNEELQQQYQDRFTSLQKELDDKKAECDVLKEENETAKTEREELTQTITNLRVQERALQLKLRTLQERQSLEKAASDARTNTYMISLKTQAGRQIDEAKAQLEQTRQAITKILVQQFNEQPEEDATFQDLFNKLDRRLQMFTADKRILADAIKLRGDLKLAPNVSLSEAWATEQQVKANAESAAQRSQNERRVVELELSNLKRATEKMTSDAKEANDWERWGRSLYKQVNQTPGDLPVQELRFKLSEDVLAAVKDRSTLRRLDSLRSQKKILANPAMNETPKPQQELSMRSVLSILVFSQRVQGGFSSPTYTSPRKDTSFI